MKIDIINCCNKKFRLLAVINSLDVLTVNVKCDEELIVMGKCNTECSMVFQLYKMQDSNTIGMPS